VQECYVGIVLSKDRNELIKKENQSFNKLTKSTDLLLRNVTLKEKIHLLVCYAVFVGTASFS
jgi:hypothetical protein